MLVGSRAEKQAGILFQIELKHVGHVVVEFHAERADMHGYNGAVELIDPVREFLFDDGIMYYMSDCMKGRSYYLFTITPEGYEREVIYF